MVITPEQSAEIQRRIAARHRRVDIARDLGVSVDDVNQIATGTYGVPRPAPEPCPTCHTLSDYAGQDATVVAFRCGLCGPWHRARAREG